MPALPFAKIYRKIYDGPLGKDPVKRAIFTDMCVLADPTGRVQLDYPYLAAVTGWPAEVLIDKLNELTRPEPGSGSQKEEGAPLLRTPWGWQIVNYAYYRNLRPRNDERRKAYRRQWMRNKRRQAREQREPGSQREQSVNKREQLREQGVNTGSNGHYVKSPEPNELQKPREQGVNSREHLREQSVNPNKSIEERVKKKKGSADSNKSNQHQHQINGLADSEWLARLAHDKTYAGIDVHREFGKMANYCRENRKLPTRRRFVAWLNRIELLDPGIQVEEEKKDRGPEGWEALAHELYPRMHFPQSFWDITSPEVMERIKERLAG
jgi:hypothetical protein